MKKKKIISVLLVISLFLQMISDVFVENNVIKANQKNVPALQVNAQSTTDWLFYVRVSKEEFPEAPYIYAWANNASVTGIYPGAQMQSEGECWSYASNEFSTANVVLSTKDGWSSSSVNITGKATYSKAANKWSGLKNTNSIVNSTFYVCVSKEEFPEAPYVYAWVNDASVTGIYPGMQMQSEGKYWSYGSTEFSSANVVLSNGAGWSSTSGNISGKAIYSKETGKWTALKDSSFPTATPTKMPDIDPTGTGTETPVINSTSIATKEPEETQLPEATKEATQSPTETQLPEMTNEPTQSPVETQAPEVTQAPEETQVPEPTNATEHSCVISFDAQGGTISTDIKTVIYGQTYGILPAAIKKGYNFVGWYTEEVYGTKVTEDTIVSNLEDHNLYAHWTVEYKNIGIENLSYSFINTRQSFGYDSDYKIPLEVYQAVFGNTTVARQFYDNSQNWSGNCFGMAATSILFNVSANDVDVTDYNEKASDLGECLPENKEKDTDITLTRFIEMMHIAQKDSRIQKSIFENKDDLDGLCQAAENSVQQQGYPVIIGLYDAVENKGHAVVGYKISGEKLYIYDPNMPYVTRFIRFSLNSKGKPASWSYMVNDEEVWGSEKTGCWITYIPYETFYQVWSERGNVEECQQNLMRLNTDDARIYDGQQNLVAEYKNGELTTSSEQIYELVEMDLERTIDGTHSLYLPVGVYTVENTDQSKKNITINMVNVNLGTTVTTSAKKVEVSVDDAKNQNDVNVELKDGQEHDVDFYVNGQEVSDVTIKAFANLGGSIEKEGCISVAKGTNRSFKIQPADGYEIADVLVNGESQGPISSYEFKNIQSDCTISASFKKTGAIASSTVKKGMLVTVGTLQYKVTKVSDTDGTVMLVKSLKNTKEKISVPDKIAIGSNHYKVTSIKENVFSKHKKLKSVSIGKNVTTIGKKAFYGDSKLKTITIKSKVLNTVGTKAFSGIYKKAVLKVPKEKYKAYKKLFEKKGINKNTIYKKI